MSVEYSNSFPPSLLDSLGSITLIRRVDTKAKSEVIIAGSARGKVVLKRGETDRLKHEYLLLSTILPSTEIRAPRALGLFEDDTASWLVTEFVDGRPPELSNKSDRLAISRWVAHLHVMGHSTGENLPLSPVLLNPYERLDDLERLLTTSSVGDEDFDDLVLCRRLRTALPVILEIGSTMTPTLTHRDLAEQNFVTNAKGLTGLDWERAQIGTPLIDLWIVDPAEYRAHQIELGVAPEACTPMAAFAAGTVLARLAHNIARKTPERRHKYLRTAIEAAELALVLREEMK